MPSLDPGLSEAAQGVITATAGFADFTDLNKHILYIEANSL